MKTYLLPTTAVALALLSIHVSAAVHYVDLNCTSPASPYTDWTTAATNIQDAVDVANPGETVLVTNGVYASGGAGFLIPFAPAPIVESNRVMVAKAVTVQSVNGAAATAIRGFQVPGSIYGTNAMRCVYLTNGAVLSGFTLMNGATRVGGSGGGIYSTTNAIAFNCILSNNAAHSWGGGGYGGTLSNCTFVQNVATNGGGAASARLTGCLVVSNVALKWGGGAYSNTLENCTLLSNTAAINGGGAAYGVLSNCLIAGNSVNSGIGGGTYSSVLNNCVISNNSAASGGGLAYGIANHTLIVSNRASTYGGGAYYGTLNDCNLYGNTGVSQGGGAYAGTLNFCSVSNNSAGSGGGAYGSSSCNCLVVGNRAATGGGIYQAWTTNCTVVANYATNTGGGIYGDGGLMTYNSIIYYNMAPNISSNSGAAKFNYCCTRPYYGSDSPDVGTTNEPLFVNRAAGDFHLQSNSPCINAGYNARVIVTNDLDGNPRIIGGTVDIGAYECQSPALLDYYTWLQNYGLPTDASLAYTNSDGDGVNNWQEYLADTSPIDANDYFHITSFTRDGTYITLWWTSKPTRLYQVQRRQTLGDGSPWETIITNAALGWNNVGFDSTGPQCFYRIQAVQP